jgi:hypothetical protein
LSANLNFLFRGIVLLTTKLNNDPEIASLWLQNFFDLMPRAGAGKESATAPRLNQALDLFPDRWRCQSGAAVDQPVSFVLQLSNVDSGPQPGE